MSERFDDSGDNADAGGGGALKLSKVDSFDVALDHALRVSLCEDEERQHERERKKEARKRVREEAKVAPPCRVLYPEAEAEVPKQAFRKLKEDKIVIDVMSSDEEAPVAADGGGKGRAGARQHVAMGVRVEAPRAAPSQHAPRVERGAWRPEQRLRWSTEGQ